mmetsp:Transcript_30608/g.90894  ORF Transcript_30608/g.90894 Transcript_30608/m.90894 type:complete len:255 (-) Transcript_30608:61-825(-)
MGVQVNLGPPLPLLALRAASLQAELLGRQPRPEPTAAEPPVARLLPRIGPLPLRRGGLRARHRHASRTGQRVRGPQGLRPLPGAAPDAELRAAPPLPPRRKKVLSAAGPATRPPPPRRETALALAHTCTRARAPARARAARRRSPCQLAGLRGCHHYFCHCRARAAARLPPTRVCRRQRESAGSARRRARTPRVVSSCRRACKSHAPSHVPLNHAMCVTPATCAVSERCPCLAESTQCRLLSVHTYVSTSVCRC